MEIKEPKKEVTIDRLRRKLLWSWLPESVRESGFSVVRNFWLHWFPARVTRQSLSFRYSLWLGTISFVLFLILVITGIFLMFYYIPYPEAAYQSVKDIENIVPFGRFIRSLHRIAAHMMLIAVFAHMVRVFLTGAFKNGFNRGANRPLNWLVGVALLLITLFLSFTGYLLPWDQLAYWAITVGTNIAAAAPLIGEKIRFLLLGGNVIGQNALIRFYVLHCVFLPLILLLLFAYHMWRIRKDGGLAVVEQLWLKSVRTISQQVHKKTYALLGIAKGIHSTIVVGSSLDENETLPSMPTLTTRIFVVLIGTLAVAILLAAFTKAPLEEFAKPASPPNPAKAPWYFLWLQELVAITTIRIGGFTLNGALIGGILIPGILVILLALWPFLDRSPGEATGIWLHRSRRIQNIVFLVLVLWIIALILIGTYLRGPNWEFFWPWEAKPPRPTVF